MPPIVVRRKRGCSFQDRSAAAADPHVRSALKCDRLQNLACDVWLHLPSPSAVFRDENGSQLTDRDRGLAAECDDRIEIRSLRRFLIDPRQPAVVWSSRMIPFAPTA